MDGYKHYARPDVNSNVIYGFSDAFESMQTGDVCINTNAPRQFNVTLLDSDGIALYKVVSGQMVSRTSVEMDVDRLPVTKKKKLNELDGACNQAILAGFDYTINGISYHLFLPLTAQANFTGAKSQFKDGKITSVRWTVLNNATGNFERIDIDTATFVPLGDQVFSFIDSKIRKFRDTLEPQVKAATTIAQVNAIVW